MQISITSLVSIEMSIFLSVCLSIYLPIYLSIYPSIHPSIRLSMFRSLTPFTGTLFRFGLRIPDATSSNSQQETVILHGVSVLGLGVLVPKRSCKAKLGFGALGLYIGHGFSGFGFIGLRELEGYGLSREACLHKAVHERLQDATGVLCGSSLN